MKTGFGGYETERPDEARQRGCLSRLLERFAPGEMALRDGDGMVHLECAARLSGAPRFQGTSGQASVDETRGPAERSIAPPAHLPSVVRVNTIMTTKRKLWRCRHA
jgi:hypothetical protein